MESKSLLEVVIFAGMLIHIKGGLGKKSSFFHHPNWMMT